MHCKIVIFSLLFFSACSAPAEKENKLTFKTTDTTSAIQNNSVDVNTAAFDSSNSISLPAIKKLKNPQGIYQAVLPLNQKVEQTVAFNSDFTYQLQEKFIKENKDSIVVTEGTWMPSDGFIWLYKDQVVNGRYKWKKDTLQYYSPLLKKSFSMHNMNDALQNTAWKNKSKTGVIAFGVGNEPFWSVEYNDKDTISFLLSEWKHPLKLKADSAFSTQDSIGYFARNDSSQLRVTIFPHFCNDGMSNLTYRNKVKVNYNQKTYNGCAILFKH